MATRNDILVVLSGGQDSVTCLGIALNRAVETGSKVFAIGFLYNQKHKVELAQAELICSMYDVPFTVHEIPSLATLSDSALIEGGDGEVTDKHHSNENLPASFVPNRNALFLTIAHAFAQTKNIKTVMTGVCETDYSGYPDCRNEFIESLEQALNLGYETDIKFETPLMWLNKAQTFALAQENNFLSIVLEHSHTCYNGDHSTSHDWGFGCGACPACELREQGYNDFTNGEYE